MWLCASSRRRRMFGFGGIADFGTRIEVRAAWGGRFIAPYNIPDRRQPVKRPESGAGVPGHARDLRARDSRYGGRTSRR